MEQCAARLDVAMFNAILRKSADEIPADPQSDPITDLKVLPIPAGKLSFKSGVQLKHVVRKVPSVISRAALTKDHSVPSIKNSKDLHISVPFQLKFNPIS